MSEDVTIGEVYRLVKAVREEHGGQLAVISTQTSMTSSMVGRHEERLVSADREIQSLRSDHGRVVWAIFGLVATIIGSAVVSWLTRP